VIAVGSVGIGAPANTPAPILERLAAEMQRMLVEPVRVEKLRSLYFVPAGESLGRYASFISSEIVRWRSIVQAAGVKVE